MYPIDGQKVLLEFSSGIAPILVQYVTKFSTALVTRLQLWHFHFLVSVHSVRNLHEQIL
jgi:hypothetical protein